MVQPTSSLGDRLCEYCGWDATDKDHLLPRSWTGDNQRRFTATVWACSECNVLLGDRLILTIEERRAHLYGKLTKRYARVLKAPPWTEDEIDTLDGKLRNVIGAKQALRLIVQYRLDNLARDDDGLVLDWETYYAVYQGITREEARTRLVGAYNELERIQRANRAL